MKKIFLSIFAFILFLSSSLNSIYAFDFTEPHYFSNPGSSFNGEPMDFIVLDPYGTNLTTLEYEGFTVESYYREWTSDNSKSWVLYNQFLPNYKLNTWYSFKLEINLPVTLTKQDSFYFSCGFNYNNNLEQFGIDGYYTAGCPADGYFPIDSSKCLLVKQSGYNTYTASNVGWIDCERRVNKIIVYLWAKTPSSWVGNTAPMLDPMWCRVDSNISGNLQNSLTDSNKNVIKEQQATNNLLTTMLNIISTKDHNTNLLGILTDVLLGPIDEIYKAILNSDNKIIQALNPLNILSTIYNFITKDLINIFNSAVSGTFGNLLYTRLGDIFAKLGDIFNKNDDSHETDISIKDDVLLFSQLLVNFESFADGFFDKMSNIYQMFNSYLELLYDNDFVKTTSWISTQLTNLYHSHSHITGLINIMVISSVAMFIFKIR